MEKDIELFRLLICYALAKTRRQNETGFGFASDDRNALFVYVPPHFTDNSPDSMEAYWPDAFDEEAAENVCAKDGVMIAVGFLTFQLCSVTFLVYCDFRAIQESALTAIGFCTV